MTPAEVKAYGKQLAKWADQPQAMVRELFGVEPDEWQEKALRLFPRTPRLAMVACKGPGKTTVLAWLGWNYLLTRPHCNIGAISITVQNLGDGLWKEMAKWQEKAPLLKGLFTWTKTRIFANEAPATWFMSAKSWPKSASTEEQAKALAGFHADYIAFLVDESGGMPDAVMFSAEAAFAGTKECHIVQAGNPSQLSGPLYRADRRRDLWEVINITGDPDDPMRSPRIPIEYAREQIKQWGRDNNWVKTDIFGEFPSSSIDALIGQDEVEAAMARYYREYDIGRVPKVMGIDVARFGNDGSSLCKRQGIQIFSFDKRRNIDSLQGASWVNREWGSWGADAAFIDATGGFGSGWEDQLRVLGRSPIGVHFSSQANDKAKFYNKRSEMAFEFVTWIKKGGALPGENVDLMAALTQTTYTFQNDRMLLEPKEMVKAKIGRSPDDFDAAILTFAEPIALQPTTRKGGKMLVDYNPFAEVDKAPTMAYPDYWN
jgi:phage terminase large subunit